MGGVSLWEFLGVVVLVVAVATVVFVVVRAAMSALWSLIRKK